MNAQIELATNEVELMIRAAIINDHGFRSDNEFRISWNEDHSCTIHVSNPVKKVSRSNPFEVEGK